MDSLDSAFIGMVALAKRQDTSGDLTNGNNTGERHISFWFTRTGVIVKWSIFLGLTVILALYVLFSYMSAKRRVRRGLKPRWGTGWVLSRAERAGVDPRYALPEVNGYYNHQPNSFGMNNMAPPPVYDPNRPPQYAGAPPEGSSKVDPSQYRNDPVSRPSNSGREEYEPPMGPPPPASLKPQGTGNTNPFLDR